MAKCYQLPGYADWDKREDETWDQNFARQEAMMETLRRRSDAVPEGQIEGLLISFGVADGGAHYVVARERPLTLHHVPYLDGYQIDGIMMRGLRAADIRQRFGNRRLFRRRVA